MKEFLLKKGIWIFGKSILLFSEIHILMFCKSKNLLLDLPRIQKQKYLVEY